MAQPTVVAGHHLAVYINGEVFGLVTSMQWAVNNDWKPLNVIDFAGPVEFLVVRASGAPSASCAPARTGAWRPGASPPTPRSS
jgi:hypothetical protein